jgi:hypothetical protein
LRIAVISSCDASPVLELAEHPFIGSIRYALESQDDPTEWAILDKIPDRLGGILKSKRLRNDGLDLT